MRSWSIEVAEMASRLGSRFDPRSETEEPSLARSACERVIVVRHLANDMLGDSQGGCRRRRWCIAHQGDTRLVINHEVIDETPIAAKSLRTDARPRANKVHSGQLGYVGVGTTEEE
jgi:hypothetical protein